MTSDMTGKHRAQFLRGVEQFNERQFFEAHETWEEIWLATPAPDKAYLQGIIQISAAFHHYRRGNPAGTRSLLEAALKRLEQCPGVHFGIAVEPLRASATEWVAALSQGLDLGAVRLPVIQRVGFGSVS